MLEDWKTLRGYFAGAQYDVDVVILSETKWSEESHVRRLENIEGMLHCVQDDMK